jgi:hypothetical protein
MTADELARADARHDRERLAQGLPLVCDDPHILATWARVGHSSPAGRGPRSPVRTVSGTKDRVGISRQDALATRSAAWFSGSPDAASDGGKSVIAVPGGTATHLQGLLQRAPTSEPFSTSGERGSAMHTAAPGTDHHDPPIDAGASPPT